MLSRRGWGLAAASLGLVVAGSLFAVVELLVAGAAGAALVAAAAAYVRWAPVSVDARRALHPARLQAGGEGDVEITVRNTGARASPVVAASDPFDGGRRWARFRVAPLAPRHAVRASYRVVGEKRGVYQLGPLELRLEDPFGLASRPVLVAPATRLVVYPKIETLEPLVPGAGERGHARAWPSPASSGVEGDLYALREYQTGDDLRRVHWRSTAKLDELMIRHDEAPRQGSATVLLDVRAAVHTADSLEAAVSAAASIANAAWRRRWPVRLVTSDGADSGLGASRAHLESVLERLAASEPDPASSSAILTSPPAPDGGGGMVAVVTTAGVPAAEVQAMTARAQPRTITLVLVHRAGTAVDADTPPPGAMAVWVGPGRPLPAAWAAAMGAARGRAPVGS